MNTAPLCHPAWLSAEALPAPASTPAANAQAEADAFFRGAQRRPSLTLDASLGEGYRIDPTPDGWSVTGGEAGLLYGVHALIRALRSKSDMRAVSKNRAIRCGC